MANIAVALVEATRRGGGNTALIAKERGRWQRWTFSEIHAHTASYAGFLRGQGICPGDRVMLMVKPSKEFVCLAFALFAAGAVVILIDPGMGYRNLLRCIGSVKPSVLIGIPKAQLFSRLFRSPFVTIRRRICVGRAFGLLGTELPKPQPMGELDITPTKDGDLAAIIFTTGSTGPPKGVRYEHRIFQAQLDQIRDYYRIGPGDVDQPAFPLFALFSIALGASAVIPDMDPTRPAQVDPEKFIQTINEYGVTYSFGSPAIWSVISRYALTHAIRLPSLRKVLMAGAPVSGELIERLHAVLHDDAEIHIPYGATESLPIVSITGREALAETWPLTQQGLGVCVGRALPGIEVRIIPVSDDPLGRLPDALPLRVGDDEGLKLASCPIGEIIVRGPVVTMAYDNNDQENLLAKIQDGDGAWHRVGDLGYCDDAGRVWFCGRKAHRVRTANGTLYTICCEAVFNCHPLVSRSALVGVGEPGRQLPVLIVEPNATITDTGTLFVELRKLALQHAHTAVIENFLVHDSFPVDIRHNAKIFREKLAVWAAGKVSG